MGAYDNIHSRLYLNAIQPLSSQTRAFFGERMKTAIHRKGESICVPGDRFSRVSIIKRGLVRGYYRLYGQEITSWISIDDEVFTTTHFFSNSECAEHVQALEPTYVEYLEYGDYEEGLRSFPDFALLRGRLMEMYYAHAEKRALISRIPNASNRFEYFLNNYNPEIIRRSPKKCLASFLNMRPETLSRLVKEFNANRSSDSTPGA